MRFKTDENIHPDATQLLRMAGHDVLSVREQNLRGTPDNTLARVCQDERRALLTLDLDFADIRSYPPELFHGVIVLRLGSQSRGHVVAAVTRLLRLLEQHPLSQHLWIADEVSVRVRAGKT